jgi:hypothetical protein
VIEKRATLGRRSFQGSSEESFVGSGRGGHLGARQQCVIQRRNGSAGNSIQRSWRRDSADVRIRPQPRGPPGSCSSGKRGKPKEHRPLAALFQAESHSESVRGLANNAPTPLAPQTSLFQRLPGARGVAPSPQSFEDRASPTRCFCSSMISRKPRNSQSDQAAHNIITPPITLRILRRSSTIADVSQLTPRRAHRSVVRPEVEGQESRHWA